MYLRDATAEGRLQAHELEERLGAAFAARTYRQLQAVTSDLPAPQGAGDGAMPIWVRASLGLAGAVGLLAAASAAAVIFAGIASASMAWTLFGRLVLGRVRRRIGPLPAPVTLPAPPARVLTGTLTSSRSLVRMARRR